MNHPQVIVVVKPTIRLPTLPRPLQAQAAHMAHQTHTNVLFWRRYCLPVPCGSTPDNTLHEKEEILVDCAVANESEESRQALSALLEAASNKAL